MSTKYEELEKITIDTFKDLTKIDQIEEYTRILFGLTAEDYQQDRRIQECIIMNLQVLIHESKTDITLNPIIMKIIRSNISLMYPKRIGRGNILENVASSRNLLLYQSIVEHLLSLPKEALGENKVIKEELIQQENLYLYLTFYVNDRNLETVQQWISINKPYFLNHQDDILPKLWVAFRELSMRNNEYNRESSDQISEKDYIFINKLNQWFLENGFSGLDQKAIEQIKKRKFSTIDFYRDKLELCFKDIQDNKENPDQLSISVDAYKKVLVEAIADFTEIREKVFLIVQLRELCSIKPPSKTLQDLSVFIVEQNVPVLNSVYTIDILDTCIDTDNVELFQRIKECILNNHDTKAYENVIKRLRNNEKVIAYLGSLLYNRIENKTENLESIKKWIVDNKNFFSSVESSMGMANQIWVLYRNYSTLHNKNNKIQDTDVTLLKELEQWLIENNYQGFHESQKSQIENKTYKSSEDWLDELRLLIKNRKIEKFRSALERAREEYPDIAKRKELNAELHTLCQSKPPCEAENELAIILIKNSVSLKNPDPASNLYFDNNCMDKGNYILFYEIKNHALMHRDNPLYSGVIQQLETNKYTLSYLKWMIEPPRNDYEQATQWINENKDFFSKNSIINEMLNIQNINLTDPKFIQLLESIWPIQEKHPLTAIKKCRQIERLNNCKSVPEIYKRILIDDQWKNLPLITKEGLLVKDVMDDNFEFGKCDLFYLPEKIPPEKITPDIIRFFYDVTQTEKDDSKYDMALKILQSEAITNPNIEAALYDHFLKKVFEDSEKELFSFINRDEDQLKRLYIGYLVQNRELKKLDLLSSQFPGLISIRSLRDHNQLSKDIINTLSKNYAQYKQDNPQDPLDSLTYTIHKLLNDVLEEKRGGELCPEALSILAPDLHRKYLNDVKELIQVKKKTSLTPKLSDVFFATPEYTVISNHEGYDAPKTEGYIAIKPKTGALLEVNVEGEKWPVGYNIFIPKHKKPVKFIVHTYGGGGDTFYTPTSLTANDLYLLNHGVGIITLNLPDLLPSLQGVTFRQALMPEKLFNINLAAIKQFMTTFYHTPEDISEELKQHQGSSLFLYGASFGGATTFRFAEEFPELHQSDSKILAGIISHDGVLDVSADTASDLLTRQFKDYLDPSASEERLEKLKGLPLLVMQNFSDGNVNVNVAHAFIQKAKAIGLDVRLCATTFTNPIPKKLGLHNRGHFIPTEPISKLRYAHMLLSFIQNPSSVHSDYVEWQIFKQSLAANQFHHNALPEDKFQRPALRMLSKEKLPKDVVNILTETDNATWQQTYEPLFKSHWLAYTIVRSQDQCERMAEILMQHPEYIQNHAKNIILLQALQMQYYNEEKYGITQPYSLDSTVFSADLLSFMKSSLASAFKGRGKTFFLEQLLTQIFIAAPELSQELETLIDDSYRKQEQAAKEKLKQNYTEKARLQEQLVKNYKEKGLDTDSIRLLGTEAPSEMMRILKQIPLSLDLKEKVKKYQSQYSTKLDTYIPEYKLTVSEMIELLKLYNETRENYPDQYQLRLESQIKEWRKAGHKPIENPAQSSLLMYNYQAKAEFLQFLLSDTWDADLSLSEDLLSEQKGQTCKLYALGHAMKALNPKNAPKIRADKKHLNEGEQKPTSLRHVAKEKYESRVGEMYSPIQLQSLAKDFGYEVDIYAPQTKEEYFNKIKQWLQEDTIPNIYFNVSLFQERGFSEVAMNGEDFEHAGIITAYKETEAGLFFKVSHWGKHYVFNAEDLWRSIESMPVQREGEVFIKEKDNTGELQWKNVRDPNLIEQYKTLWFSKGPHEKLYDKEGHEVRVSPPPPNPKKQELALKKTVLGVKKPQKPS